MPIMSVVRAKCAGCIYNKLSQCDHELCLYTPLQELLDRYLPDMLEKTSRSKVMEIFIEKVQEMKISTEKILELFKYWDPFTKLNHDNMMQHDFKQFLLKKRDGNMNGGDVICSWLYT